MRTFLEQETTKRRIPTSPTFNAQSENQYSPSLGWSATSQRWLASNAVLALQQTRGNAAVCRMLAAQRQTVIQRDDDTDDVTQTVSQSEAPQPVTAQPVDSDSDASQTDNTQPAGTQLNDSDSSNDQRTSSSETDTGNDSNSTDNQNDDSSDSDSGTPSLKPVTKSVGPRTFNAAFAEATGSATDNPSGNLTINSASYQDLHNGTTRVTGQATASFAANVSISLPAVPDSITDPCERDQYQQAINTTLNAHELQHKRLFEAFDGSITSQFSEVGATVGDGQDMPDVTAALSAKLVDPPMDRTNSSSRLAKAEANSAAIDPFNLNVDLSKCNNNNNNN